MIDPTAPKPRRSAMQVGLRHLLFATMAVAAWTAHFVNTTAISSLSPKLDRLRKVGRELVIKDPAQITIVSLDRDIDVPLHWNVYIPNDDYELCFSTRNIDGGKYPSEYLSKPLKPGRFELAVREVKIENNYDITLLQNDAKFLNIKESSDWRISSSTFSSGAGIHSQQYDGNAPFDIHRMRFGVPIPGSPNSTTTPSAPSNGMLLWIQKRR